MWFALFVIFLFIYPPISVAIFVIGAGYIVLKKK